MLGIFQMDNNNETTKRIAIINMYTDKYNKLADDFINTFNENFVNECKKTFYIFTDSPDLYKSYNNVMSVKINHTNKYDLLIRRYSICLTIKSILEKYDYIVLCNGNMRCVKPVTLDELLNGKEYAICTHGLGYKGDYVYNLTEIKNPNCAAYYPKSEYDGIYYQSGFQIGTPKKIFIIWERCVKMFDYDVTNKYICSVKFQDESYINKFLHSCKDEFGSFNVLDGFNKYLKGTKRPWLPGCPDIKMFCEEKHTFYYFLNKKDNNPCIPYFNDQYHIHLKTNSVLDRQTEDEFNKEGIKFLKIYKDPDYDRYTNYNYYNLTKQHLTALLYAKEHKYPYLIITDSSCKICDDFINKYNECLKSLPYDWGIIKLGSFGPCGTKDQFSKYNIGDWYVFSMCGSLNFSSHAYIINSDIYDDYIELLKKEDHIDKAMDDVYPSVIHHSVYNLNNPLILKKYIPNKEEVSPNKDGVFLTND